jgi:hypothetical protein
MRLRSKVWPIIWGVTALCAAGSLLAAPGDDAVPDLVGPLKDTAASHAFSAAAHQNQPLDLAGRGYMEEEYVLRGRARVFDWGPSTRPEVLAEGAYVTRALVRRPRDPVVARVPRHPPCARMQQLFVR